MWSDLFDLHSHSTNSDGEHSVETVAQLMASEGVKHWSLTDHDTIAGWVEAERAATKSGMNFIPGVEITCEPGLPIDDLEMARWERDRAPASWHLLAYFPLTSVTGQQRIDFEAWLAPLGESRVGRPHLADECIALGYVETRQEAFDKWLGDGRPLSITREKPTIKEATAAVHACGGITSLAHPIYYGVPVQSLVEYCKNAGVDAIECFHRSHPDSYRHELLLSVRDHGLKSTCGSDFHGLSNQQTPGNMPLPLDDLPGALRA